MKPITYSVLCLFLLTLAAPVAAEDPPPFMSELYPPELIMRHGRDVGVRDEQRQAILKAVAATQEKTLQLQWDVQEAAQTLAKLVRPDRIDEKAALDAATRVMDIEARVKRAHLGLLIQIKNQLDPDQQKRLRELRGKGE